MRTRGHVVARVVRQRESSELLHLPALVELARVTRGRGAQPVVDFGGGAYVAEYGLYDLVGGKLIRMGVLPLMPVFQNTFPSGGSNAGSEPSFCARGPGRGAVLVASFRFPHGPTHGDLYLQQGTTFKVVAWNRPLTALERQNWQTAPHGLRPEIFGDCAVAVAPR